MVRTVLEGIQVYYNPRTIYIITSEKYVDEINKHDWNINVIGIPEETFFMKNYGLTITDIENLFNNNNDERSREFGWWYQQLIKLGAHIQIEGLSDPFIVWDSDLIPLKKWDLYPTHGEPFFKFAILQEKARSQWNIEQYKSSLMELTNLELITPIPEGTFVPHHYVLHHKVLDDLYLWIREHNKTLNKQDKNWIYSIMSLSHKYFRFSEYLTLSSFMMKKYPELLHYHCFEKYGKNGYRIRDSKDFVEDIEKNCPIHKNGLSYKDFYGYVENQYKEIPSYLQIEHI
jgi:hypothetical protein